MLLPLPTTDNSGSEPASGAARRRPEDSDLSNSTVTSIRHHVFTVPSEEIEVKEAESEKAESDNLVLRRLAI